jgi:two-component system, OmpR family, phosphate regulon sensor histidine kinase PhoR
LSRKRPQFPWKLLARFLLGQILVLCLVFAFSGVPWTAWLIGLLAFVPYSLWAGRKLLLPLWRILRRIESTEAKGAEGDSVESLRELEEEEPEEWFSVESAFSRMRTDLTLQKDTLIQEREELAALMASISDAILAVDSSGNLLFFNSRFALLFGGEDLATDPRPTLGQLFRSPEVLEAFHGALGKDKSHHAEFQLFSKADGVMRGFSLTVTPLRRPTGEAYGTVGIFHDVTELKRAERVRIDFVANVSHELRTPLTAIKGYTDTLESDLREGRLEALPQYLDVISRNVERLMALIEDLLDLSSLESGVELQKSHVQTRELTQKVIAQLEHKRSAKNQGIECVFEAESLEADPRRVEQVLVNLIENAIKYVPHGGEIRVEWKRQPGAVRLRVSDNGPGIPREAQERIFERFYRMDKARSRELGGTGLGLAIVKHVMQRHGGTVWVNSELGKGSEFFCEFPSA